MPPVTPKTPQVRKDDPAGNAPPDPNQAAAPPGPDETPPDAGGPSIDDIMKANEALMAVVGKIQQGAQVADVADDLASICSLLEGESEAEEQGEESQDPQPGVAGAAAGEEDVAMQMAFKNQPMQEGQFVAYVQTEVNKIKGEKNAKKRTLRHKALMHTMRVAKASFESTETATIPVFVDADQVVTTDQETTPVKPGEGGSGNNFEDDVAGGSFQTADAGSEEITPPVEQPTGSFAVPGSSDLAKRLSGLEQELAALKKGGAGQGQAAVPWPENLNTTEFRKGVAKSGPPEAEDFGRDPWA